MARHRQNVRSDVASRRPGPLAHFAGFTQTILVLFVILYGAALLLSRTAGFRSLAADRLQDVVGLPVKIAKSHARWNLDIELQHVTTESNGQKSQPGLRADRVVLDWSPLLSLRRFRMMWRGVEIEGGDVTFATTVSGQWEPAPLAPVSEQIAKWLGLDLKHHVKADAEPTLPSKAHARSGEDGGDVKKKWNSNRLRIRNTNIGWWVDATNELARLDGLALDVTPLDTPGHHITHYLLKLDRAESSRGFKMSSVNIELMDAAEQQIVLSFQADRETTSSSGGGSL